MEPAGLLKTVASLAKQGHTHNPTALAAIRLLLLTGARRSEILGLQWRWVDFERGLIRLPDSKTGAKNIHLNAPARAVLAGLPRLEGNQYVFPGQREGKPFYDIDGTWTAVRLRAGLDGVRLHDLRHTHASVGVAGGLSLPIVGALLGHSQPVTTQRYAHLSADPLQAASEIIGERIFTAMSAPSTKDNVHALPLSGGKRVRKNNQ